MPVLITRGRPSWHKMFVFFPLRWLTERFSRCLQTWRTSLRSLNIKMSSWFLQGSALDVNFSNIKSPSVTLVLGQLSFLNTGIIYRRLRESRLPSIWWIILRNNLLDQVDLSQRGAWGQQICFHWTIEDGYVRAGFAPVKQNLWGRGLI